jgi:hypothetical protein
VAAAIRLKAFPRHRLLAQELFACPANEVDLIVALGEPTAEYQPSLGEGTPILFWDLEWPCGLVTGLQFDPLAERVSGFLDQPEVSHALRHLGLEPAELWILERDEPTRFTQVCPDPPIRSAHLWRVDGDLDVEVAAGLTQREAECLADGLAAAEPGERYQVREGALPEHRAVSPPPSDPPRIRDRQDLFDEMLEDTGDDDPASGGAADHVRQALIRRTAQAVGREASSPPPDDDAESDGASHGASADVESAPGRPARRRDLFR